ncbi:MAG: BT_3928 family protein [Hyphomicrobiales bacterium]
MKALRIFSRLFVGLVFMFSGFVKGVDPLGTTYKIEDYFIAFNFDWAMPYALPLSILLCAIEFGIGASLFFNLRTKSISWILLPLMIFFTGLTYYDYISMLVPDCGCFGDFIKLSAFDTFLKNVILLLFSIIVFLQRKRFTSIFMRGPQSFFLFVFFIVFIGFSFYNYRYIPVLDFRDWKVGNNMIPDNKEKAKMYVTYMNKETGEEKEYLSPNYPWKDSVWVSQNEFVKQRVEESNIEKKHDLVIQDALGNDVTDMFIENQDFTFLVVAYDLSLTNKEAFIDKIEPLFKKFDGDGYPFIIITSSLPEDVEKFKAETGTTNIEYYFADDIVLKSMIRSNPGLMLMKDGVVLGKWGFRDIPNADKLTKEFSIR